ncbi:MAG: LOG family protein [Candidatus Vogelbacteria bacterium]|nr:LOG family protein [Candidatus Vogelbacteria bacterium]
MSDGLLRTCELGNCEKHAHRIIKIAVSGSAATTHLTGDDMKMCEEIGREVARQGATIITGATTGVPIWAAKGAKLEGGTSVGLSPASGEREHVELYKLPLEYMDFIMYTGFGYVGRDILMTRTADAVIIGPGRIGTIHEFTVAFEDKKPIGILQGPWDTDKILAEIIEKSHRKDEHKMIVFDPSPKVLVEKVIKFVQQMKIDELGHPQIRAFDPNALGEHNGL